MSMSSRSTLFLTLLVASACVGGEKPAGLGIRVDPAAVAAVDFAVMPDGQGLPEGSGNAGDGRLVYERSCRHCHGVGGQGGVNDRLTGGAGSLSSAQPVKTIGSYWPYATTIFDYIRRAMPYNQPGSLSPDEVYAVTAYLLAEDGIIETSHVLDAQSLPLVRMPNRNGFTRAWPGE